MKKDVINELEKTLKHIDNPKSSNTKWWNSHINAMSDEKFIKWFKDFLEDPDKNIYVEISPDDEPTINDIRKAAAEVNCELEHTVYYRHGLFKDNPVGTRDPVMVGVIPIKMLQQTTPIKLKRGDNIGNRSIKTGQATGSSRVVNVSEPERNALIAQNANTILKELTSARSDNEPAKQEMYRRISEGEAVRIEDLPNDPRDKTAMRSFQYYLLGACLHSDILKTGLLLPAPSREVEREITSRFKESDSLVSEIRDLEQHLESLDAIENNFDDFSKEIAHLENLIENSTD